MIELLILLYFLSVTGYIVGLLLSNIAVRDGCIDLWYKVSLGKERNQSKDILLLIGRVLSAIYQKKGILSFKKLLILILLINTIFFVGLIRTDNNFVTQALLRSTDKSVSSTIIFYTFTMISIFIGSLIFEYLSYKMTWFFFSKSLKKNSLHFLFLDLVLLILLFYVIPIAMLGFVQEIIEVRTDITLLILFFSPFFPLAIVISSDPPIMQFLLMMPALFSLTLPTLIILISLLTLYNKYLLSFTARAISFISESGGNKIRQGSLVLFTFCTGSASILSLFQIT